MRKIAKLILFGMLISQGYPDSLTSQTQTMNRIEQIRHSFWCVEPVAMGNAIKRYEGKLNEILAYAREGDDSFSVCFSTISNMLDKHNNQFPIGIPVEEAMLRKLLGPVPAKEHPEVGTDILSYLLLELARMRESPRTTKEVLETVYKTYLCSCYLNLSLAVYEDPKDDVSRQMLEKMLRGEGVYGETGWTLRIAWCCLKFMDEMATSKPHYFPPSALATCEAAKKWADSCQINPVYHSHMIMKYVLSLSNELP